MSEIALILAAFFTGTIFGGAAAWSRDECPRMIMGYKCRGIDCNHSRAEVMSAHKAMNHETNHWKGDEQ